MSLRQQVLRVLEMTHEEGKLFYELFSKIDVDFSGDVDIWVSDSAYWLTHVVHLYLIPSGICRFLRTDAESVHSKVTDNLGGRYSDSTKRMCHGSLRCEYRLFKQLDLHGKGGLFFGEYLFCKELLDVVFGCVLADTAPCWCAFPQLFGI
jgi:hypothetical protein